MVAAKFVIASILLSASASASSVNYRRDGYNPIDIIVNGVKSGITNAQQQVQSLVRGFQSNDGHPTADGLKALITGLDGQIDNSIGVVADLLSPLTFGLSNQVEAAILGPFFQSVTDGAEVAISNIIGTPIDAVLGSSIQSLANNMNKMVSQATQLKVDQNIVANLAQTQKRVANLVTKQKNAPAKNHRRALATLDGIQTSVNAARQSIESLASQLSTTAGGSTAALSSLIDSIDAQIDGAVGNVNSLLAPYTTGLTSNISNALLGSFLETISNSANTLLDTIGNGGVDASLYPSLENFAKSIQTATDFAGRYNLNDRQTQLININHRIHLLIKQ